MEEELNLRRQGSKYVGVVRAKGLRLNEDPVDSIGKNETGVELVCRPSASRLCVSVYRVRARWKFLGYRRRHAWRDL